MAQRDAQGDKAKAAGRSGALLGGGAALALVVAALIGWAVLGPDNAPEADGDSTAPTTQKATPAKAADGAMARIDVPDAGASGTPETAPAALAKTETSGSSPASPPSNAQTATVQFDALRAAPDGSVTLAGRVEPDAKVEILVDGQTVARETADGAGNFASLFDLPASASARALSLRVTSADGVARDSAESLVLRPAQTEIATAQEGADPSATPAADEMAQATPAPIVTDATGARLLAPASDTLVIDTVAFGQGLSASAEGRGAPEGTKLGAYLDGELVAQTQAGRDGRWSLDLPGLSAGAHKLRIDATGAAGKVIARAETAFEQPDQIVVATAGASSQATSDAVDAARGEGNAVNVVQIVQGNTLWAIAREVYGDGVLYVRVFDANRDQIRNPDLIYPGQVFTIPSQQ
ncbi:LysM peptidoglycan-binding domain-containing protein [Thioclava sp.]|uniref:LysM peptidoglycan-binding domain-containing protein n=1 Tax=Thioclava sp. TaxID=1933450 RepID=UPI003AA7F136